MEPPIELSELMERIRAAVRAENRPDGQREDSSARPVQKPLPEALSDPAELAMRSGTAADADALEWALAEATSMLPRARQKTEVSASIPKLLRSLYRNQGGFNGIVIEASERLVAANRQLQRQNVQLQARLEAIETTMARQHEWMAAVTRSHEQSRAWMTEVEAYLLEIGGSEKDLETRFRRRITNANGAAVDSGAADVTDQPGQHGVAGLEARLAAVNSHADRLGDHLTNLQAQVDDQEERYADWHTHFRQAGAHHDLQDQNTRRLEERQHNDASYFKNQLWFLQRMVEPLIAGGKPGTETAEKSKNHPANEEIASIVDDHGMDALYLAFEDAMRGNRNEIKERTSIYLPYITAARAGTADRPVLDLGCGRGEWLELLGERGLSASGVDLNTCMIEVCRERALPAIHANALDHLRDLPDASCGAVTAFHLIEHLPFAALVRFLRDCRRVLLPGGVAIFETPNPYNVLVGSGYFYHDFTHQRPLPPNSTKFLVEQMGFAKVEILPLNPWDEAAKVHGEGATALEWRFNELFYGPQDYALIATP